MTRKEQIKILNNKIESNTNQYKVDRLNAEISAFSSGDLNKYELLTRKDLKYKPNALDKARFEFSPLGKTFSKGLDKTVQGYQEEGVIKLLKDIRDGLRGGVIRPNNRPNNDNDDNDDNDNDDNGNDNDDDNDDNDENKIRNMLSKFENNVEVIKNNFNKKILKKENDNYDKLNRLKNKVKKINNYTKKNNDKTVDMEKKLNFAKEQYNNLLLGYN